MVLPKNSVLTPHRCVGQIFGKVPAAYYPIPESSRLGYIGIPIGSTLYVYSVNPFRLITVTASLESQINLVAYGKSNFYCVDDRGITVVNLNGSRVRRILHGELESKILFLIPMGDVLICIEENGDISVVDEDNGDVLVEMATPKDFKITAAFHPDTYWNKIVLCSSSGAIRIMNIKTGTTVHEFEPNTRFDCAITAATQSSVKDVVAFGLESGFIHFFNLKTGQIILSLKQEGAVRHITFRTDGYETMATSNDQGTISLYNLVDQMLISKTEKAHNGKIYSLFFLLGQPNMISGGADNRLVRWFMETDISAPLINKEIEGHSAEITSVVFSSPTTIITSGLDGYVRKFNIYRQDLTHTFGAVREVKKKGEVSRDRFIDVRLEPIVEMKLELMREHVWENITCIHRDSPLATTWSSGRTTKGSHLLFHQRYTKDENCLDANATTTEITNSGDICLVGYTTGHVDVYNMQSGRYLYSLQNPKIKMRNNAPSPAHSKPICGIFAALNSKDVITVAVDGSVIWWELGLSPKFVRFRRLRQSTTASAFDRESGLLAIGLTDGSILILDSESGITARTFSKVIAAEQSFTVLRFSPDSNYLMVADDAAVIRMFDLRESTMIGALRCENVCTRAVFDPTGLFLATTHRNQTEVLIWRNRLMFGDVAAHDETTIEELPVQRTSVFAHTITLTDTNDEIFELGDEEEEDVAHTELTQSVRIDDDDSDIIDELPELKIVPQLANTEPGVLMFSDEPAHRWESLAYIDLIEKRNTIRDVERATVNVPFFLQMAPNEGGVVVAEEPRQVLVAERSLGEQWTNWALVLRDSSTEPELIYAFHQLQSKPTTQIDYELRSIPPTLLSRTVEMLTVKLRECRDADFTHAILGAFLRHHNSVLISALDIKLEEAEENGVGVAEITESGDAVAMDSHVLSRQLTELAKALAETTAKPQQLFNEAQPVLKWIKSALI